MGYISYFSREFYPLFLFNSLQLHIQVLKWNWSKIIHNIWRMLKYTWMNWIFNVPSVAALRLIQFYVVNYYNICMKTLIMEIFYLQSHAYYNRVLPFLHNKSRQCASQCSNAITSSFSLTLYSLVGLSSHTLENKFDLNVSQIGTYIHYQYEKTSAAICCIEDDVDAIGPSACSLFLLFLFSFDQFQILVSCFSLNIYHSHCEA